MPSTARPLPRWHHRLVIALQLTAMAAILTLVTLVVLLYIDYRQDQPVVPPPKPAADPGTLPSAGQPAAPTAGNQQAPVGGAGSGNVGGANPSAGQSAQPAPGGGSILEINLLLPIPAPGVPNLLNYRYLKIAIRL